MWDGERVGVILRGGKREMKEMGERVTINWISSLSLSLSLILRNSLYYFPHGHDIECEGVGNCCAILRHFSTASYDSKNSEKRIWQRPQYSLSPPQVWSCWVRIWASAQVCNVALSFGDLNLLTLNHIHFQPCRSQQAQILNSLHRK
jgi:hypothetical protein